MNKTVCSVCRHDTSQCFEDYIGRDGDVYNECTNCGAKPAREITTEQHYRRSRANLRRRTFQQIGDKVINIYKDIIGEIIEANIRITFVNKAPIIVFAVKFGDVNPKTVIKVALTPHPDSLELMQRLYGTTQVSEDEVKSIVGRKVKFDIEPNLETGALETRRMRLL